MLRRHSASVFRVRQQRKDSIPRAQTTDSRDSLADEVEVIFDLDERALAELPALLQANMREIHAERLSRLQSPESQAEMDEQWNSSPGPSIDDMVGEHQDRTSIISCTNMTHNQEARRASKESSPKKALGSEDVEMSPCEAALSIPRIYSPHLRKRKRGEECSSKAKTKSRATRFYVPAAEYKGDDEVTQGRQLRKRISSILHSVRGKLRKGMQKARRIFKK